MKDILFSHLLTHRTIILDLWPISFLIYTLCTSSSGPAAPEETVE